MPAKAVVRRAAPMKTPSPASRLLRGLCGPQHQGEYRFCRRWLASEGGRATCRGNEDAFAGKPAPTGFVWSTKWLGEPRLALRIPYNPEMPNPTIDRSHNNRKRRQYQQRHTNNRPIHHAHPQVQENPAERHSSECQAPVKNIHKFSSTHRMLWKKVSSFIADPRPFLPKCPAKGSLASQ